MKQYLGNKLRPVTVGAHRARQRTGLSRPRGGKREGRSGQGVPGKGGAGRFGKSAVNRQAAAASSANERRGPGGSPLRIRENPIFQMAPGGSRLPGSRSRSKV